jgi:cytosine/uracil/thiamine/allantoin permease
LQSRESSGSHQAAAGVMIAGMRRFLVLAGLLVAAFGTLCLNFTSFSGAEHHREWAQQHGLPEPSDSIFFVGIASTVCGAALAGFTLGRPKTP